MPTRHIFGPKKQASEEFPVVEPGTSMPGYDGASSESAYGLQMEGFDAGIPCDSQAAIKPLDKR